MESVLLFSIPTTLLGVKLSLNMLPRRLTYDHFSLCVGYIVDLVLGGADLQLDAQVVGLHVIGAAIPGAAHLQITDTHHIDIL